MENEEEPIMTKIEEAGAGSLVSTIVSVLVLVVVLCVGGILFFKLRERRGDAVCRGAGTPVQFKSKVFKNRVKGASECSTTTSLGSNYSTRINPGGDGMIE